MSERIILISGACGHIGRALAHHWDTQGVHLLLLDSDTAALNKLDQELKGDATLVPFDLWRAPPEHYEKLATMIAEDYGHLDVLVHLAGFCGNLRQLVHCTPENWLKGLHINLTAPYWLTQNLLGLLRLGHAPRVIFTLHERHREQPAYWHSFGIAQAGLKRLLHDFYEERAAYPEVGFAAVDPHWLESPMSRAIFPAGDATWRSVAEILPLFDAALSTDPDTLTILEP